MEKTLPKQGQLVYLRNEVPGCEPFINIEYEVIYDNIDDDSITKVRAKNNYLIRPRYRDGTNIYNFSTNYLVYKVEDLDYYYTGQKSYTSVDAIDDIERNLKILERKLKKKSIWGHLKKLLGI